MILIQARSTSRRFPRKHLAKLGRTTVLDVLIDRVSVVPPFLSFAFVIPYNDPLGEALKERKVQYFEGPEDDVLKRYMMAMDHFGLDWCIRLTGDCPFISPQDIFWMASICGTQKVDYGANCLYATTDGQEIEFISRRLMEAMDVEAKDEYSREHVTPLVRRWIRAGDARFIYYVAPVQFAWTRSMKLSIDTPEDLETAELIMTDIDIYRRLSEWSPMALKSFLR